MNLICLDFFEILRLIVKLEYCIYVLLLKTDCFDLEVIPLFLMHLIQ